MTNREAIEVLNHSPLVDIGESLVRQAFGLAITALREKAEKDRRFVVKVIDDDKAMYIWDSKRCTQMGYSITYTEERYKAATRIADIYEEMYK